MGEWLDLQTDMSPYRCDMSKVADCLKDIDTKLEKFNAYCGFHPKFKDEMFSATAQERRSRETAMAFLGIEKPIVIDETSSFEKSEIEREIEEQNIKKLLAYADASQYMKDILNSEAPYLDQTICIRTHSTMCQGEENKHLIIRYDRFRNERDPLIIVGQGYFNPVEGELVQARMDLLFQKYYEEWKTDHPIVKGSKFLTEYYRIQPHMDGNKRMALLCMNFILQKEGYPDVRFRNEKKEQLFDALKVGVLTHDVTPLVALVADREEHRVHQWLEELVDFRLRLREDSELEDEVTILENRKKSNQAKATESEPGDE